MKVCEAVRRLTERPLLLSSISDTVMPSPAVDVSEEVAVGGHRSEQTIAIS